MSRRPVIITPVAQSDIEANGDYIALENPARAASYVNELIARCQSLRDHPERFPLANRPRDVAVRKCTHGRYLIFYRVYVDRVSVARVLHAASDYEAELEP